MSTVAGSGGGGVEVGDALTSAIGTPVGLAFLGGDVIFSDLGNRLLRVLTQNKVDILAGSAGGWNGPDGPERAASFFDPRGVAVGAGDEVFVADLRRVAMIANGDVSTIQGTSGVLDVASAANGALYLTGDNVVRVIREGIVSTFAGDGKPGLRDGSVLSARFAGPSALALDADGTLYVGESDNHTIRSIRNGQVTLEAGCGVRGFRDGPAATAMFGAIGGLAVSKNRILLVSDGGTLRALYLN